MSGIQIFFLIWLILLTLGFLVLLKVVYILASDRLERADRAEKAREQFSNLRDPKNNPFLKAGLEAVRKQKEGSQNG